MSLICGQCVAFISINKMLTRKVSERKWGAGIQAGHRKPVTWPSHAPAWVLAPLLWNAGSAWIALGSLPSGFWSYPGCFESRLNGTLFASIHPDSSSPKSLKVGWTFTFFFLLRKQTNKLVSTHVNKLPKDHHSSFWLKPFKLYNCALFSSVPIMK